jgi:hypothetical protein
MTLADLLANFKKQPIGSVCGALAIILAGLLYFRNDLIAENQASAEAKAAEAAQILSNTRHAEGLAKQVEQMQAFGKDTRLIRAGQLGINLQYFYKLEAENQVKLLDVRQGLPPKVSKGLYLGIPYNLSVQGSFKQVVSFLQHLENGPHFCRFITATYSKAASAGVDAPSGAAGGVTLNLTLELLGLP